MFLLNRVLSGFEHMIESDLKNVRAMGIQTGLKRIIQNSIRDAGRHYLRFEFESFLEKPMDRIRHSCIRDCSVMRRRHSSELTANVIYL